MASIVANFVKNSDGHIEGFGTVDSGNLNLNNVTAIAKDKQHLGDPNYTFSKTTSAFSPPNNAWNAVIDSAPAGHTYACYAIAHLSDEQGVITTIQSNGTQLQI